MTILTLYAPTQPIYYSPRAPITKILEFSFSTVGHFEKWPKHAVGPNFFTGNMWNLNQMSPLNKMIPLAEVLGGGGAWGAIGARGLLYSHANCTYVTFWGLSYIIGDDGVSYIFGGKGLS